MSRRETTVTEREIRRRKSTLILKCIIALLILLVIGLAALLLYETVLRKKEYPWSPNGSPGANIQIVTEQEGQQEQGDGSGSTASGTAVSAPETAANLLAAQYDYDAAIELLKSQPGYDRNESWKKLVVSYQQAKASCVSYPVDQITHVFFHTLICDTSKAFDGDSKEAGYNQVMTTIDEFNSIIQQMYNRGYVMVSLHDMCSFDDDGNVTKKEIYLPAGKIPFVLSQDDVSYYHYMDGDGFAQKLIVADDGTVRNTYIEDDGSISIGDYDMVPLIDRFVEQHPDFSYHGHKGIIALTGYEGVLGYRTDEVYQTREESRLTEYQRAYLEENPDFDYEAEVAEATAVADAMKAEGWEFASHTWGHINPRAYGLSAVQQDTERWLNYVAPVVGDTDVLIFAFGADIEDWHPYTMSNEYFAYLKGQGFNIYCNVDGSVKYWVQFGDDYMRQGRRNLDGYRMYYNPELVEDLFDVDMAWDDSRPTPVPEM